MMVGWGGDIVALTPIYSSQPQSALPVKKIDIPFLIFHVMIYLPLLCVGVSCGTGRVCVYEGGGGGGSNPKLLTSFF